MARGRLISKSLGSSRRFHALVVSGGKLGEFCQVLFPLIVANTDDFGRMDGDAFTIKNVVLPSSKRQEEEFEQALVLMAKARLITRYTVEGSNFLQVNKFDEHQPNLHKRTKSRFPEIPESPGTSENYRPNLIESNLRESKGTQNPEENLTEPPQAADHDRSSFEVFWMKYPKKVGKDDARKAWQQKRPDLAAVLSALSSQAEWLAREGGKYTPNPSTWLNQGRWQDEPPKTGAVVSTTTQQNLLNRERAMEKLGAKA